MADQDRDEPLNIYIIPENFVDTGRCFNGMFKTSNLIEGIAFAAPVAFVTMNLGLSMEQTIVTTTIAAGGVLLIFLNGINDNSVLEFVAKAISFGKKKRISRYNPRIKVEARPEYLINTHTELPRDKVMRLVNQFHNMEEDPIAGDIYNPQNKEFFEDDFGQLETPDELKSAKERLRDRKEAKQIAKKQRKESRRMKKELKKRKKKNTDIHVIGPDDFM